MRYISIVSILLGAISVVQFAPQSFAQDNEAPVPTITRLVKIFSSLESEWMEAVRKRDGAFLDRMLADDFEMRSGPEPGRPTARADWIKQSFRETPFPSSIEQMAVHDFGNVALVSFLWKLDAPKSSGFAKQLFVVDTWELEGGSWRAKVRYIAPNGEAALLIPGVAQGGEVIKKKY